MGQEPRRKEETRERAGGEQQGRIKAAVVADREERSRACQSLIPLRKWSLRTSRLSGRRGISQFWDLAVFRSLKREEEPESVPRV